MLFLPAGAKVAGGRGYFLKGYGVLLNQALINYSLAFLQKKEFSVIQPNCLMTKESMAKCAQLSQFDEELYKVSNRCDLITLNKLIVQKLTKFDKLILKIPICKYIVRIIS